MNSSRIFLIGFMGSGKSTAGQLLAQKTGFSFLDTDEIISQTEQKSIADIFASQGENAFRLLEKKLIHELIQQPAPTIIATGGGLPVYHDLMPLLLQNGTVIYLQCASQRLFQRLQTERQERPLLAASEPSLLLETINDKLKQRTPVYEKAHIIINGDQSPEAVVTAILEKLG